MFAPIEQGHQTIAYTVEGHKNAFWTEFISCQGKTSSIKRQEFNDLSVAHNNRKRVFGFTVSVSPGGKIRQSHRHQPWIPHGYRVHLTGMQLIYPTTIVADTPCWKSLYGSVPKSETYTGETEYVHVTSISQFSESPWRIASSVVDVLFSITSYQKATQETREEFIDLQPVQHRCGLYQARRSAGFCHPKMRHVSVTDAFIL